MKKLLGYIPLTFLLVPFAAGAIGVSASPPRLEAHGVSGRAFTEEILVSNPSRDVAIFDVYPDDFESVINVLPASFVLESGDQKKIILGIKPKDVGRFETNVSVVARPLSESAFNAASGVKIPFNFEVMPSSRGLALISSALPVSARTGLIFGYVILVLIYIWFLKFAIQYLKKS